MITGAVTVQPLILIVVCRRELHRRVIGKRITRIALVSSQNSNVVTFGVRPNSKGGVVGRGVIQSEIRQLNQQLVDLLEIK